MPNSAWRPGPRAAWAAFERAAQRSVSSSERSAASRVAGYAKHSSSGWMMSAPSACWTSSARSGERKCVEPSTGDRNSTPPLADPAELRQAPDLEPAGVGEERAVPRHEPVEAAELADELVAGPEQEVEGVAEHDLRARRTEVVRREALHGAARADGHEHRRLDRAVAGRETAGAGGAVGGDQLEGGHRISVASP